FKNQTMELEKASLEKRAVAISETLSILMDGSAPKDTISMGRGMGMMGTGQIGTMGYLRFLDDIAMADIWIVDEQLNLLTIGHMDNQQYNYGDLPLDAEDVVKNVFRGETTFSEGFSQVLDKPTLTVGTPVKVNGMVVGAVLLHSPVEGINNALLQGFGILAISILCAFVLSIVLSVLLALSFTKPLKNMKNTALELSNANYEAKTGVAQQDEIGELAQILDILSDRLYQASKESEQLDQLRKDFVANISHELRTPVTVLRGSLEALRDGVVADDQQIKEYYRQMLNESMYLQRLIDDLLDLSRLQNINFKIEKKELNLCDVLDDIIRSAQNLAESKSIEIQWEQDTLICIVSGDYGRLRQMLMIILDNAIKFSKAGSKVSVSLKERMISIRDNGAGIAAQDLPYIFDRFYKVKSEENKNGTGLGLSIAKQIADRHGIQISVESEIGKGTEFQFRF
ncbi:MAG: ATP-binding protein, partial [Bacillota bacterium]